MADLYIRWSNANPKDVGDRPIAPCWPPNAVWTNASIWMSYPPNHPDPAKRNTTADDALKGAIIRVASHAAASDPPAPSWAANSMKMGAPGIEPG